MDRPRNQLFLDANYLRREGVGGGLTLIKLANIGQVNKKVVALYFRRQMPIIQSRHPFHSKD